MKKSLVVLVLVAGCERITETAQRQSLGAALSGAAVKPAAVSSTGEGTMTATLRALRSDATMEYSLTFSGLAGTATAAHLHGPASADNVGDLLVDLGALPAGSTGTIQLGVVAGSAAGTLDLRGGISSTVSGDSLHKLLDAGVVYVDVHTTTQAGGEIRGQLRKR